MGCEIVGLQRLKINSFKYSLCYPDCIDWRKLILINNIARHFISHYLLQDFYQGLYSKKIENARTTKHRIQAKLA